MVGGGKHIVGFDLDDVVVLGKNFYIADKATRIATKIDDIIKAFRYDSITYFFS